MKEDDHVPRLEALADELEALRTRSAAASAGVEHLRLLPPNRLDEFIALVHQHRLQSPRVVDPHPIVAEFVSALAGGPCGAAAESMLRHAEAVVTASTPADARAALDHAGAPDNGPARRLVENWRVVVEADHNAELLAERTRALSLMYQGMAVFAQPVDSSETPQAVLERLAARVHTILAPTTEGPPE